MKKALAYLAVTTALAFSANDVLGQKLAEQVTLHVDTEGAYAKYTPAKKKQFLFFPQVQSVKVGMLNAFPASSNNSLTIPLFGSPEARSDLAATTPFIMIGGVKTDFVMKEQGLTITKMAGLYNFRSPAAGVAVTKKLDVATVELGTLYDFKNKSLPHSFLQARANLKELWGFQPFKGQVNTGTVGAFTGNNGLPDGGRRTRLFASFETSLPKNLTAKFTAYAQNLKQSEGVKAENSVGIVAASQMSFGRRGFSVGPTVSYDTKSKAAVGINITTQLRRR